MDMNNKQKHTILRVRKVSMTDRGRLSTQVIRDKKKEQNKRWCRDNTE